MWMHVCTFLNWTVIGHDRSLCYSIFFMSRVGKHFFFICSVLPWITEGILLVKSLTIVLLFSK